MAAPISSPVISTITSALSSTAAPSSSASSACSNQALNEFPTKDAACAVRGGDKGVPDKYSNILKGCCKDAPVESWNKDCALWCLAADQSIADLQKCWQEGGVDAQDIFCTSTSNATATGDVKSSGGSSSGGDKAKETGSQTSGETASGPSSTSSEGAAPAVVPQSVSKAGVGMLALVLGSAVFGALL